VVRLAFLAPDIIEAIMAGLQPAHLTMKDLMDRFPAEWGRQPECAAWTADHHADFVGVRVWPSAAARAGRTENKMMVANVRHFVTHDQRG